MKHDDAAKRTRSKWQLLVSAAAMAVSGLMYWMLQVRPVVTSTGFSWHNFRQYFPYDQYSYLAIAVNVKNGNLASVEPFTETGTNHYPRLYYVFLGLLSRLFHTDVVATWQVAGLAFQFVMVGAISWLLIRLTGVPALGALGFVPSIVGTFAVAATGNWHHALDNHGVLWGSFGVLFTLNGESAALSVAVTAICLLIGVTFPLLDDKGKSSMKARTAAFIVCGAAVGVLANVQTYSFLTAVYLLVYVTGAYGLLKYGRKWHVAVSLGLLAGVLLGGTTIAATAGPLVTLMAGLLAAAPGFWLILLRYKVPVAAGCGSLALAASPTILGTLLGLADKDDFLTYRELSSNALGVPLWTGLLGSLVPLLMLTLIFLAGLTQGNKTWLSFSLGAVVAWPLVATNDLWGANQEPYRFWIDSFTIVTAASVPVFCQVAVRSWHIWRGAWVSQHLVAYPDGESPLNADKDARFGRLQAIMAATGCIAVVIALGVSVSDYSKFSDYVHAYGTASFNDPQALAIKTAALPLTEAGSDLRVSVDARGQASELVMFDPCISPFRVKALTGLPTAFYNLGLAWPRNEKDIREILVQRSKGLFAQPIAQKVDIRYVLTDTGCPSGWQGQINGAKISEASYSNGGQPATITLWKILG
ncbi:MULTISPECIES: hypothetical protein [unclassified Arthrobacter]|uniref:hypothetical protein n=1 Tax=unclassified Arthrobacter TaxID=235627 RepID=UPI001C860B76|nr:hypothetical protein [Arthrobacter sp. MAHUQ-56]MBX7445442.1 hypothetical protein [Arthrobacter sp. MAHUQ-56]